MNLDGIETEARHVLATMQQFPLWPPEQAVATLAQVTAAAARIASVPPPPDPAVVDAAHRDWFAAGRGADSAAGFTAGVGAKVTPQVWSGATGDAVRESASAHATRVGSGRCRRPPTG